MVGPDFHKPKPPCAAITCGYTPCPTPRKTVSTPSAGQAGKSQHFIFCEDISSEWWRVFHSECLNKLICAGLANSPNMAAAKAALLVAQENYVAQVGTLYPTVAGNFSGQRQRFNAATFGGSGAGRGSSIFNLYNVNVTVSYVLDVFGGLRRQIEVTGAQVDYQEYELEAAFLTLTSNIVTTAITIASYRAQIQATQELIRQQNETLKIVRQQFRLGGASQADILTQESQLAQTQATLPPLQQNFALNMHALSVLIGELPCEDRLPCFDLDKFHLPRDLPLSIPSLLVRHRPDIRAAEASLHIASAQIGVAAANMYPQITLSGSPTTAGGNPAAGFGYTSDTLSSLIRPDNRVWAYGVALTQPIFNGFTLVAKKRAAVAAYQQAYAQYRQTVLQGFQNVADTLRALEHDAQLLKDQKAAEISARNSMVLTRQQYRLGATSYLNLLIAERTYQNARIGRIQAQAARYTDTAALFQALGGGWWNRSSLDCNPLLNCNVKQYRVGR